MNGVDALEYGKYILVGVIIFALFYLIYTLLMDRFNKKKLDDHGLLYKKRKTKIKKRLRIRYQILIGFLGLMIIYISPKIQANTFLLILSYLILMLTFVISKSNLEKKHNKDLISEVLNLQNIAYFQPEETKLKDIISVAMPTMKNKHWIKTMNDVYAEALHNSDIPALNILSETYPTSSAVRDFVSIMKQKYDTNRSKNVLEIQKQRLEEEQESYFRTQQENKRTLLIILLLIVATLTVTVIIIPYVAAMITQVFDIFN